MDAKDTWNNKNYVISIPVIMKGHPGWVEYNPTGICLLISGRPEIVLRTDDIMKEIFLDQPGESKTLYTLLMGTPAEVALANRARSAEPAASSSASTGEEEIAVIKAELATMKAEIVAMKAAMKATIEALQAGL